jgi:anthranilate synthase component II
VILLVDNYDSFTYNLAHLFGELGADVVVRRNDTLDGETATRLAPSHLVISPGPGRPADAGATVDIVLRLSPTIPTLGVCLGHQAIVEAFGGEVGAAHELVHGKACAVSHDGRGVFAGLPDKLEAVATTRSPPPGCPTAWRCRPQRRTARSWRYATGGCRSTASSSILNRC